MRLPSVVGEGLCVRLVKPD